MQQPDEVYINNDGKKYIFFDEVREEGLSLLDLDNVCKKEFPGVGMSEIIVRFASYSGYGGLELYLKE